MMMMMMMMMMMLMITMRFCDWNKRVWEMSLPFRASIGEILAIQTHQSRQTIVADDGDGGDDDGDDDGDDENGNDDDDDDDDDNNDDDNDDECPTFQSPSDPVPTLNPVPTPLHPPSNHVPTTSQTRPKLGPSLFQPSKSMF